MNQTGANKAIAGGAAGAATILLCWAIETFGHLTIPAEVASAITTLIGTFAVWITPHSFGGTP